MSRFSSVEVFAPAKVNLALHITGQRQDGYHLIDSLVAFASVGDRLTVTQDGRGTITVTGPFARAVPTNKGNLLFSVADAFWKGEPLSFALHKALPVASGIGGGSADAAACYRAISALRAKRPDNSTDDAADQRDATALLAIGADVPMCVRSVPARVEGIGEKITPLARVPELNAVLINPRVSVSTPTVFKSLLSKSNPPLSDTPAYREDSAAFLEWLAGQRNDLEPVACAIAPVIRNVLENLRDASGCLLARMSGSGATCFGLFPSPREALQAETTIRASQPDWWVKACTFDGTE